MTRADSDRVVHRGRAVAGWLWWDTWAALLAAAVVPTLVYDDFDSTGDFLAQALGYGVVWGLVVWIVLITLWSMEFYGKVTLTRSDLRVGRDRVPLAELDPAGVRAVAANRPPSLGRRVRSSMGDVHVPTSRPVGPDGATFRYLGGSFGTPVGTDAISLPTRDGGAVRFSVRDRGALLAALYGVLPAS